MAGTKFVVDFGDVQLPKELADKLDRDIRQMVTHTIAGLDFHADESIKFVRPPKGIYGLISQIDKKILERPQLNLGRDINIGRPNGG
ncbi:hypothetical protein Dxin01_01510 [Deinococcus xinjiangensis]|uniref:Uncharacterized protein n=1 Tax=Deinococcus xinjiangensis TaxID=457454 RepID=A0ABP9VAX6_9DEIO